MRCNAAVLLGILCFCFKADAQIVNVENARMQSDTVGWLGSAGASLSVIKNTTQIFSIGTEAHVQYKTKNNQSIWLLLGDFNFLKAQNKRFVSDDLFHLRPQFEYWREWGNLHANRLAVFCFDNSALLNAK